MTLHLICNKHKEIIFLGNLPVTADELITLHSCGRDIDAFVLWTAFSRFMFNHSKCDCLLMAEPTFYDQDWSGYRVKDNEYGLPFNGPENVFDL
jgi:hypothetical protein